MNGGNQVSGDDGDFRYGCRTATQAALTAPTPPVW